MTVKIKYKNRSNKYFIVYKIKKKSNKEIKLFFSLEKKKIKSIKRIDLNHE